MGSWVGSGVWVGAGAEGWAAVSGGGDCSGAWAEGAQEHRASSMTMAQNAVKSFDIGMVFLSVNARAAGRSSR